MRVEPVTLILTALAAGASAGVLDGLKGDVKEKARAAYARLHGLAGKRVSGRPHGELALAEYQSAPQKWEGLLAAELRDAGAAQDADLVAAAKALMELIDQPGARSGKYTVIIKGSAGFQVGDGNVQVNQGGQWVGDQIIFPVSPPGRPDRVDASLVGRWECVASAGYVTRDIRGPWDLSGSYFVRFGADGRGRADYANWRVSVKLAGRSRAALLGGAFELVVDGGREFTCSTDGRSYQETPDPFVGNVRCTLGGIRLKEAEAGFRLPPPTNCNYMVTGDMLALYSDTWRKDYRRCGPG
jgi:hypothetical protein